MDQKAACINMYLFPRRCAALMTPRLRTLENSVCCGFWVENKGLIVISRPPCCNRHRSESAKCKYSSKNIQFNTINWIKINDLSKDPFLKKTPNKSNDKVNVELMQEDNFTNMKYDMCCILKNDLHSEEWFAFKVLNFYC